MEFPAVFLWAFLSLLPFSNAITCSEIVQCEYDSVIYANAQLKNDVVTQCRSVMCMEAAVDDCKKNPNFPKKKLQEVQQVLEMHKDQVLAYCPSNDQADTTAADSQRSRVTSSHTELGPADIAKSPACTDIMTCMFDMTQFKKSLKENRLLEACRCLRLAIKDCKENRLIDNSDLVNATHSLTDAEKLLENYCGYSRDKEESTKDSMHQDISTKKQEDGHRNESKPEAGSSERYHKQTDKKDIVSSYETLNQSPKHDNDQRSNRQNDGHNDASALTTPWQLLLLVVSLHSGSLNCLLFRRIFFTDIITSFY